MPAGKVGFLHRKPAVCVGALIVVVIVALAFGAFRRVSAIRAAFVAAELRDSYASAIAEAKRDGIPVTPQALQEPLPPADQNAAPIYAQITDLLTKHPLSKQDRVAEDLVYWNTPSKAQLERVRKALSHRSDVMNLIHKAALRPECVFVRDWRFPIAVKMPEIGSVRTAARLLAAESALLSHDGMPLAAATCMGLAFRIARHVERDNYMMGYMTARMIDYNALRGLQKILYTSGNETGVGDAVRSVIEKEWRQPDLARAFRSRAGATVVDLEVLRKLGPAYLNNFIGDNSSPSIHMTPQRWDHFINDNGSVMLRLQREEAVGAQLPYPRSFAALSAVDREADKESSPIHLVVTVETMPVADFAKQRAELQAHVETTRVAAALLAYENRRGSLPATLDDALSPIPTDPFDGKPLQYRRERKGFVVYSVGVDGKLAGGEPGTAKGTYDVVFRYPMPGYWRGR